MNLSSINTQYWIEDTDQGFIETQDQTDYPKNKNTENIIDLTKLVHLHQASILHILNQRYINNLIYTYSGPILIAVNPFKKIPYQDNQPHPNQIADKCYTRLNKNQSILVNGESGAGKTETTKIILRNLTNHLENGKNDLTQQILATNPILESFGNAKTIRNHNSSRFGKFIKLSYDNSKKINGAWIDTYLLEQIRITQSNNQERNFHIFYQLFDNPNEFNYLKSDVLEDKYLDDKQMHEDLLKGFEYLNITKNHIENILNIVRTVVYLGNLSFDDNYYLNQIIQILKISKDDFKRCIQKQKIEVNNEIFFKDLSDLQITNKINSLARYLYSNLFNHIVNLINNNIGSETNSKWIGILDIFGFEVFQNNSLEQLAINYTNENLQNLFNNYIFNEEQKLYLSEGIEWDYVDFPSNQNILDLISKKPNGIIHTLSEVCRFSKGTDKMFIEKINKCHNENSNFKTDRLGLVKGKFIINHYAGEVEYNVDKFIEKNRNNISNDLLELLSLSENEIISLFPKVENKKSSKVIELFQKQLKELIKNINTTEISFIRCLKPNDENIADNFNRNRILQQLAYNGVLEAVKVSRSGFPIRFTKEEFESRFWMLPNFKVNEDFNYGLVGNTTIFFKDYQYKEIEKIREEIITVHLLVIQKNVRMYLQKPVFY